MSSKSTPSTEPFLFLVEVFVRVAGLLTLCFIFQYYSKVRPDVSIWTIFDQYRFFFKICLLTYTKPKLFIQGHLLMSVGSSRKLLYLWIGITPGISNWWIFSFQCQFYMSKIIFIMYTVLQIFRQVFFWAGNQGNHQNFEKSLLSY